MTGTVEPQKKGFPGWLKIVLIVGTIFVVAIIVLATACTRLLTTMADPKHVKQIASTFMDVKEPPGGGFEYALGFDIGPKMVAFANKQKTQVWIVALPEAKDLDDPEKALNKIGKITDSASAGNAEFTTKPAAGDKRKFEVTSKDSEKVGGRMMSYAVGYEIGQDGSKQPTFIGIFPPGSSGSVCVFGQSVGDKYDLDATKELLHSINTI